MERVVYTNNDKIEYRPYLHADMRTYKPEGLWYSIDGEWEEWVLCNMEHWACKFSHKIEVDESKLLIVSTIDELKAFVIKYRIDDYNISWSGVMADGYYGVEFRNYGEVKNQSMMEFATDHAFYWGLDCSSGCIWNMKCIKGF